MGKKSLFPFLSGTERLYNRSAVLWRMCNRRRKHKENGPCGYGFIGTHPLHKFSIIHADDHISVKIEEPICQTLHLQKPQLTFYIYSLLRQMGGKT